MICKNCGKKLQNSTDVCPECGESLRPNVSQANVKSVILKVETDDTIIWCLKKKALFRRDTRGDEALRKLFNSGACN